MSYKRETEDVLVAQLRVVGDRKRLNKDEIDDIISFLSFHKETETDINIYYEESSFNGEDREPECFYFTVHKEETESDEKYLERLRRLYGSALISEKNIARNKEQLAAKIKLLSNPVWTQNQED